MISTGNFRGNRGSHLAALSTAGLLLALAGCADYAGEMGGAMSAASSDGQLQVEPGTLTAGDWDDNLNYELYETFLASPTVSHLLQIPGLEFAHRQRAPVVAPSRLQLAFVVDATGSMGDELEFLKVEIGSIVAGLRDAGLTLDIDLALLVYRDVGDVYVTRGFDFMDTVAEFEDRLGGQGAGGGGDYPEAMHTALQQALDFSWGGEESVKMLFLIADAPPHEQDLAAFVAQANRARHMRVATVPVAASGVDISTEFLLRYAAQTTGARYVFITDDSGVGNSHLVPSIPCYHVQLLNQLLARLIQGTVENRYLAPGAEQIVRSAGNPEDGVCQLPDGSAAYIY